MPLTIRSLPVVALAALLTPAAPGGAAPADDQALRIGVLVEPATAGAARHAAAMVAEADVIWRRQRVAVFAARSSEAAPTGIQVIVRLDARREGRAAARGALDNEGLGAIWFDEQGFPGRAVVVNLDAVTARLGQVPIAGRDLALWPPAFSDLVTGRALGRVLAHEIGHYLLAWPAHSAAGLMRAAFTGRELAAWDRRSFLVDRRLLVRLRTRIARLSEIDEPLVAATQSVP